MTTSNGTKVELPAGVKLLRTLEGHDAKIIRVTFNPQDGTLASASADGTVKFWEATNGKLLHTIKMHGGEVNSVVFDPLGKTLASANADGTVKLWETISDKLRYTLQERDVISLAFDPQGGKLASGSIYGTVKLWEVTNGKLLHTLKAHTHWTISLAFNPQGDTLASASFDRTVKLWEVTNGMQLHRLNEHANAVNSLAFNLQGDMLASAGFDDTVKLWEVFSGKLLHKLEGPVDILHGLAFSPDGRLLAAREGFHSDKYTQNLRHIWIWRCDNWEVIARIPVIGCSLNAQEFLAFHPTLPLLATASSESDMPEEMQFRLIDIWELNFDILLGKRMNLVDAVHHTTAKIVLVGDHSVGKSALGYHLIHGHFKEQASTHGQQFWVFPALGQRRSDGTKCEAILWDFAGQPDYRLVHALFMDDTDLALVLFDASDLRDPLHGVSFWLKQLQTEQRRCPIILVAAQADRGSCTLTPEDLNAFCKNNNIVGPITTSALTGEGIDELVNRMKSMIPWDDKPATVTTTTFKRIKDYVLGLKGAEADNQTIVTPKVLRSRLEATDTNWHFTDAEMLTAVDHLENYGYVKRLRTSQGEQRVLLQPERLNNLASSFVLEARRNLKGLGALEEKRLLSGGYAFPELTDLHAGERDVLLDSAALLFLEHNICFRETDPLRIESYLIFPELINLKKPLEQEQTIEEDVAYTVSGPTENVFASLVVLLGYTHTFTRTVQWHNNARYEVGDSLVCGFRQEAERDGELDFVLCFDPSVGAPVRILFQGLFESFLARRNLTVRRYEPVRCSNMKCGHLLDRSVVRQRLKEEKTFVFCNECGKELTLPKMAEPIQLTREVQAEVELQRRTAEQRTRFEQAVFRVSAYATDQKIIPPACFISYAWGVLEHEHWVEKRLATDLQNAGINVILDKWHNMQIGASVSRFIERIEKSDRIIMVGTPLYRKKYENKDPYTGYVVSAEVDLIANRLLGTETQKESVLPLLLEGEKTTSLPPLLQGRVYADFRSDVNYFITAFDLILSLYQLLPNHTAVADLRESIQRDMR